MRPKYIAFAVIVVAIVTTAILFFDKFLFDSYIKNSIGEDQFRTALQFSFVTLLGGAIFYYFSILKDEEAARRQKEKDEEAARKQKEKDEETKRELRLSTKRDLAREVDSLYRSTKHIKRVMRSRSVKNGNNLVIRKEFFEHNLDELDKIQISLEQTRETIKVREDLFDKATRRNILSALRYAARYLHYVFEDFERNRVTFDNGGYIINANCKTLLDFLSPAEMPDPSTEKHLKEMEDEKLSNDCRWKAFFEIQAIRRNGNGRRFKAVAEKCIALVTSELKRD